MPGGRKTILNEELSRQYCNYVKIGMTEKDAAVLCGVDITTVMQWKRKGRAAYDDDTVEFGESTNMYVDFFLEVDKAKRFAKQLCLQTIVQALPSDPKLCLTWLGRKYPDEWGRKDWPRMQQNTLVLQETGLIGKDGRIDVDGIRESIARARRTFTIDDIGAQERLVPGDGAAADNPGAGTAS